MSKGLFIVFEGNNGAGKTTIINEIINKLNTYSDPIDITNERKIYNWNVYKFPNRSTTLGKKIDDFLKNKIQFSSKEVELKFFSDNRKEFQNEMEYILNKVYNIICDRYIYSSMAYTLTDQSVNILDNKNIQILSIDNILYYDRNFIKPDYVFLIKGNYLHLRNENEELYHKNEIFNSILFNNYIISIQKTTVKFAIINNKFGDLDNTVNFIIHIINNIINDRINKIY
jgi:thymidylate kinase